jgi:hypothetical protein
MLNKLQKISIAIMARELILNKYLAGNKKDHIS